MPLSVRAGTVIAGRFRLDRKLGEGAMGCVYAGWHINLNVPVAVKFIMSEHAGRADVASRFAQEAMAAARIDSPHVVRILDYGFDDENRPYLAMEMLNGEPLADRLDRDRVLTAAVTSQILRHAAKGLTKAHAAGIIHRDIKPDNMFLCAEEDDDAGFVLKLLDFGIAKAGAMTGAAHKTATGAIMGTPLYMSPEQAMGNKELDARTDLYSLGVVAYRALSGQVPFNSDGLGALLVSIVHHAPPPLSVVRPDLGDRFDAWFARALAKEPAARFQTPKEMAESFAAIAVTAGLQVTAQVPAQGWAVRSVPGAAPPVGPVTATAPSGAGTQALTLSGAAATNHSTQPRSPRRAAWAMGFVAASALVVAASSAVAWMTLHKDGARGEASATASSPPSEASSAATEVPAESPLVVPDPLELDASAPDTAEAGRSAREPAEVAARPPRAKAETTASAPPRETAAPPTNEKPPPAATKPPPPKEDKYAL